MDFLLENGDRLAALEIKCSTWASADDASGILALRKTLQRSGKQLPGAVLHGGDSVRPLGDHLYALPWQWLFPDLL